MRDHFSHMFPILNRPIISVFKILFNPFLLEKFKILKASGKMTPQIQIAAETEHLQIL